MDDTLLIYDDRTKGYKEALGLIKSREFNNIISDEELSDLSENIFKDELFKDQSIKKLIIPCSLGTNTTLSNFLGIRLGLHIRLSKNLKDKRCLSIIFVSSLSLKEILQSQGEKTAYLLTTEGCTLVKNNIESIKEAIQYTKPLPFSNLKTVVNQLTFTKPVETQSRHSIANQWGALKLNEAARTKALENNKEIENKKKKLYFKWLLAKSENFQNEDKKRKKREDVKLSFLEGKKVLLIDDEADKGWKDVLSKIFKPALFKVINPSEKQGAFLREARNEIKEDWDLILLDLRLTKKDDNPKQRIFDFEGSKLLADIKKLNDGTQVMIFTASNKAWNMREIMIQGIPDNDENIKEKYCADGYFIKEAPDFDFGEEYTEANYENFKMQVNQLFKRGYLRDFYNRHKEFYAKLEKLLLVSKGINKKWSCYSEIERSLKQAYTILKLNRNNDSKLFEYAFLNYFNALEVFAKYFYVKGTKEHYIRGRDRDTIICYEEAPKEWMSYIKLTKKSVAGKYRITLAEWEEDGIKIEAETIKNKITNLFKVLALIFSIGGESEEEEKDIIEFIRLNQLRNDFAHGDVVSITINDLKSIMNYLWWMITEKKHTTHTN